jgi:hypothetical protein
MKLGDTVLVNNVVLGDKKRNSELIQVTEEFPEVIKTIKLNKDGTILSSRNSYILDNGKP